MRASADVLIDMQTQMQTETTRPSVAPEHTTFPPLSSSRAEGIVWSEGLFSKVRACAGDGARFVRGLANAL